MEKVDTEVMKNPLPPTNTNTASVSYPTRKRGRPPGSKKKGKQGLKVRRVRLSPTKRKTRKKRAAVVPNTGDDETKAAGVIVPDTELIPPDVGHVLTTIPVITDPYLYAWVHQVIRGWRGALERVAILEIRNFFLQEKAMLSVWDENAPTEEPVPCGTQTATLLF